TPGIFSAAAVSSFWSLPFAIVASTGTAYSIPGKWKSEAYCALPLTFNGPSTRGVRRPIGDVVGVSGAVGVVGMFRPLERIVSSGRRGRLQRVRETALRQLDLETILAPRLGAAHRRF